MSELNRVQRWRQQQREAGKDAWTIWVPRELKLYIEDIALKRHCSPSDLVEQALTSCYPQSADITDTVTDTSVTDTSQIRSMLQQELRAFFGDRLPSQGIIHAQRVTDTDTDTHEQATALRTAAIDISHVPDTVTDTLAPPCITDTVSDTESVTDTVTVTAQALAPFDTTKYRLGTLCPRNHDYHGTGQSLRKNNKAGGCLACDAEQARERRQARRQALVGVMKGVQVAEGKAPAPTAAPTS